MAEDDMVSFHYSYCVAGGLNTRDVVHRRDAEARRKARRKPLERRRRGLEWGQKVNGTEGAEEAEEIAGARLLPGGELSFQRADEFLKRLAVRGLPLDEDEEAAAVEEDRAGNRPPALHHVQSHGGRGQLIDTRVELAGAFVRRRADAFDGGGRHEIGRQGRREFTDGGAMPGAGDLGEKIGHGSRRAPARGERERADQDHREAHRQSRCYHRGYGEVQAGAGESQKHRAPARRGRLRDRDSADHGWRDGISLPGDEKQCERISERPANYGPSKSRPVVS